MWVKQVEAGQTLDSPLTAPPTDPALYRYARFTTAALVEIALPTDAPGMSAHYLARWIGRGGAPGPWSAVGSATVAA